MNFARVVVPLAVLLNVATADPLPRRVKTDGTNFVLAATGETITLKGPNVVVKGPPYLPAVSGSTICNDVSNPECATAGTCTSCTTFNEADVTHIKAMGWNTIRLGVVWAGAQPTSGESLDPAFVSRLHAILDLCDRMGLHVFLDSHGDQTGSANCGNGVPMWFQQKAAPELIGKPLVTGPPFDLIEPLRIESTPGYTHCGANATKWAAHAGDPNYNILNECCLAMNSPNPGGLGWNTLAQKTMDYLIDEGPGRSDFIRFWTLMAKEVEGHPSVFALELWNEPMSVRRKEMFETWVEVSKAVTAIIPDITTSLADVGEGAILPAWIAELHSVFNIAISRETEEFIKQSNNLFLGWHWYFGPPPQDSIKIQEKLASDWNVPHMITEFGSCSVMREAEKANVSYNYWHYSSYCTTGPSFGNRTVPEDTFGACILGWSGGDSSKTC